MQMDMAETNNPQDQTKDSVSGEVATIRRCAAPEQ